jgi:hypothetical protein
MPLLFSMAGSPSFQSMGTMMSTCWVRAMLVTFLQPICSKLLHESAVHTKGQLIKTLFLLQK